MVKTTPAGLRADPTDRPTLSLDEERPRSSTRGRPEIVRPPSVKPARLERDRPTGTGLSRGGSSRLADDTGGGGSKGGGPAGGGSAGGGRRSPRSWRRRLAWAAVRWMVILGIWGGIAVAGLLTYVALTLPPTTDLMQAGRKPSITLQASDGSVLATYGDLYGETLRLKDLPPHLPRAVLATEDRRFYSHFGVDPIGLLRAAVTNYRAGHVVQGGSTITQQLAKNLFLTSEKTMTRKLQEALLALWLERKFTKDQLLEIYLNRVYLGAGTYGVDAAAWRYFGKSARQVSLFESSIIAGLLKAPSRFSPARDRARAAARGTQVLANMVDAGFISKPEADAAERQKSGLAAVPVNRPGLRYFADFAVEFAQDIGASKQNDLVVTTTLDPRLQAIAEAVIADTLAREGTKSAASQGALVAMAPDGAIRAMVGGRDYVESQFNRATQALRQPGSAFKPFIYLAALESGLLPTTRVVDQPIKVGNWSPRNYTGRFEGEMSLADALANSINTVTVQIAERTGRMKVAATARRLGITSDITSDATLALGTSEVTLLELTGAYAAFASGGLGAWPYAIAEIKDGAGNVLFRRSGSGPGRVIAPEIAADMNVMLAGVITRGTGKAAALDRPAAGKTGTTQEFRDALFVGYTPDIVAGVWFGNDDNTPMNKVTGGGLPAQTWKAFMTAALKGLPARPLPSAPPPAPAIAAVAPAAVTARNDPAPSSGGFFSSIGSIFRGDGNVRPAPPRENNSTR